MLTPDGAVVSSAGDTLTNRLSISGTYTLAITGANGSTGGFLLRLDAEGIGAVSVPLAVGETTRAEFVLDAPPQVFSFEQDPSVQLILNMSAEDPAFRFQSEVRDGDGQLVALFSGTTRETSLTIDAGVGAYAVTVSPVDPSAQGVVLLNLQAGDAVGSPNAASAAASAATSTPTPAFQQFSETPPIYCHVSTNATANVRAAPSTSAPAIDRLTRSRAGNVVGISADGKWYAVLLATQIGWVATQVAREVEVCGDLPIMDAGNFILPPTDTPTATRTRPPTATPTNTRTPRPTQTPSTTRTPRPGATTAPTQTPGSGSSGQATAQATEYVLPTMLPPSAPRDDDYSLDLAESSDTIFNQIISQPVGDRDDHISVQALGLSTENDRRDYTVLMTCNGEAVNLLLWGFDTTEPNLGCDQSTTVSFSRSTNTHNFIVALSGGPALVAYTLTFTPK